MGPVQFRPQLGPALLPQTERDVSVRQRAADLLYAMCDRSNAKQIVSEMLRYLETADYAIREEIVSLGARVGHLDVRDNSQDLDYRI